MPTHLALGSSVGLSDEELSWLNDWQQAEVFDETDRLVLGYTDSMTRDLTCDDSMWDALSSRFDQAEIFELCFAVGLAALVNRVHATFLTDVDTRTVARVQEMELSAPQLDQG